MRTFVTVLMTASLFSGVALADHDRGHPTRPMGPAMRLHEDLDRCREGESLCIAHVFIDVLFAVAREARGGHPGGGSGGGGWQGPVPITDPMKVEFFSQVGNWNIQSCAGGWTIASITLQKGDPEGNMHTCDLLERSLPAHASTVINCVKVDGKSRGSISALKLGEQCRAQAFL